MLTIIDRSQSLSLFVPLDKNITVELTGLVDKSFPLHQAKLIFSIICFSLIKNLKP